MIGLVLAANFTMTDVSQCIATITPRLESARKEVGRRNSAEGDIYVFDASAGNVADAKRYMASHGFDVLESPHPGELTFRAHFDLQTGRGPFEKGLKLACTVAKTFGVPFRSVERHNGTFLIYSVPAN